MLKTLIYMLRQINVFFLRSKHSIAYHSFPDFSDNSFAAFVYASENLPDHQAIWLVDKIENIEKYRLLIKNYTKTTKTIIVKKKSVKGFFYYLSADIVFHTHGLYNFFGLIPNQKKINLWHGMPLKTIGYLDNPKSKNVQISNYHVATSPFYQKIIGDAFGVPTNRVLTVGQPRNDFFLKKIKSIHSLFDDNKIFNKTLLWMPTYRKSIIGDIRIDGDETEDTFFLPKNLQKTNSLLSEHNAICYVKLHPMDARLNTKHKNHSNIKFIANDLFSSKGINMYSVFNSVDLLLTDFSSVYIDFLLLDKPIAFVFSDFQAFKRKRGFVFSYPQIHMPGEIITEQEQLLLFLENICKGCVDKHKNSRNTLRKKFHSNDKNFSKILFDKLNEKEL
jgi:CDP-glycerol glycerophosphotransferase